MSYDLQGDLLSRTAKYYNNGTLTSTNISDFVFDPVSGNVVLAFNGSGALTDRYLYGPAVDELLADERVSSLSSAGTNLWTAIDNEGSVRDVWEDGVGLIDHIVYNSFGAITSQTNSYDAPLIGYTGSFTDPDTGLQWHNQSSSGKDGRWYDPKTQQWIGPDPDGLGPDANPYRYVGNNPTNETDPTGLAGMSMSRFSGQFARQFDSDEKNAITLALTAREIDEQISRVNAVISQRTDELESGKAPIQFSYGSGDFILNSATANLRTLQDQLAATEQVFDELGFSDMTVAVNTIGGDQAGTFRGTGIDGILHALDDADANFWAGGLQNAYPEQDVMTVISGGMAVKELAGLGLRLAAGAIGRGAVKEVAVAATDELAVGAVRELGGAAEDGVARVIGPTGDTYSVAFEMKLDPAVIGRSRAVHFNRANAALDAALQSDPVFAAQMDQLIPSVANDVSRVGGRATPANWVWHHSADTGIMQLVPEAQHTAGSIYWNTLHPGGRGGYSIWAIPAGAPKN